jgi:hypothetical protein
MNELEPIDQLRQCEKIIKQHSKAAWEFVRALREIKENGLWKLATPAKEEGNAEFVNFDDYCQRRFEFSKNYANRLISGLKTVEAMPVGTDLNERQARELKKAPEDKQADAIERAKEIVGKGPLTAKVIREAVQEVIDADDEPLAVDSDASDAEPLDETPKPSEAVKGAIPAAWKDIEDQATYASETLGNREEFSNFLYAIANEVRKEPVIAAARLENLAVKIRKG